MRLGRTIAFTLIFLSLLASSVIAAEKVKVDFFFQPGCDECEMIRRLILPGIMDDFGGRLVFNEYDIQQKDNILKLLHLQESLGITENEPVMMVIDDTVALCGYMKIKSGLENIIRERLSVPDNRVMAKSPAVAQIPSGVNTSRFTFLTIAAAGLADGFNPCAFSTLIFFVSLLTIANAGRKKLILVGATYCIATFLAYTALGFGIFHFMKAFSGFFVLKTIFNVAISLLLACFAFISFQDAYYYYKHGDSRSIMLQLPDRLKIMTHRLMHSGLDYKYLIPGIFITGVAVTAIESVCTGQLYIPALILMSKDSTSAYYGLPLLVLYNLMFIIPLVIVFALAYLGIANRTFLRLNRRNVIPAKILMGTVFVLLALLLFL